MRFSISKLIGFAILAVIVWAVIGHWQRGNLKKDFDQTARDLAPYEHIELTDGFIHYHWQGPEQGPVVVMVHGFSTPLFIFEQNAKALAEAGFRVLRYDHFGRGWSDRPRVRYDVDFYDRVLVELLNALEIKDKVNLVGLSMGGVISAEFTARHPERVKKLALLVPAGFDIVDTGLKGKLVRLPVLGDFLWRRYGSAMLLSDPDYDDSHLPSHNRLLGDLQEQMQYKGYAEALLSTMRYLPMTDRDETYSRLSATGIPVLSVFGDKDLTVIISSAKRFKKAVPDGTTHIVKDAGHGLNFQQHERVDAWLVDWFQAQTN
jgi:pimeloyl-ACP methyl ester carboxylesterase